MELKYLTGTTAGKPAVALSALGGVKREGNTDEKNKGGVIGGIGYLGEKLGAGFMSSIEGIWDFSAGGIADFFGADEWAEQQMANDWFGDWYETAGEWYNPGEGWRVAGDVASGIGTSLPAVLGTAAGVALTAASGGTAAPLAVKIIAGSIAPTLAGLAAAGNATKEAYRETGELGGKEWGYGALVGTTEALVEKATGAIGAGSARAGKAIGKALLGEGIEQAGKQAAKQGARYIVGNTVKHIGKDFIGEAVEEGIAEIMAPVYARMTYDPDAKNATAEEVAYAAFVGGLSGVIMGGADPIVTGGMNAYKGKSAVKDGRASEILATAKMISEAEAESPSGYDMLDRIRRDYEYIANKGGEVDTPAARRKLGELERLTTATRFLPAVDSSAASILNNPQAAAEVYASMGLVDENGTPLEITAEKLTEGIDLESLKTMDGKKQRYALRRAISQNKLLLTLAVADTGGKLMLDAESYAGKAEQGTLFGGRGAYQNFVATATPEQKAALAERFGIEGGLDATSYEDFVGYAERYSATEEGAAYIDASRSAIRAAKSTTENEKALPRVIGATRKDGAYRYGDISIVKNGDTVRFYDHKTGNLSRAMTRQEANAVLQSERKAGDTAEANSGRRYAIKYPSYTEADIRGNMDALADMEAVATVDASKLEKTGKSPKEMFAEYFASLGNSIYSEEFGDIALGNSSVKSEIRHGLTAEKIASMEAIPDVIENGKVIFCRKRPGTDVDRIVVAAPIKIGSDEYYMGVMLQRDTAHQRLYLHNVVSIKTEEANIPSQDNSLTNWSDEENSLLLITSILQNAINVKLQKQKNSSNPRQALPDTASATETAGGDTNTTAPKTESTVREIEAWAKENVKQYGELLPNEKREIRAMVRQARALGIPEADIRRYANLEARTHVRVSFSKDRCFAGTREDGTRVYADGFYDPDTNEIVVNPEGKRSAARLILHELSHSLYKGKYGKVIDKAVRRMDKDRATEVAERYAEYGVEVVTEEKAVHHAEDILGNEKNLDRLLRDEPTIGDKILSFFGLARYGDDAKLSRAAGKLYRHFERALDRASARNVGGLTLETTSDAEGRRYALPLGEETVDARTVTEQDVRTLLNNAFKKQYRDGSYIPVRVNTPSILIEAAQNLGKTIDDLPIILNVGKARQMMSSPREWALEQKNGTAHDFSDDDVIALIRAMDKPKHIIFQTADERYVEVVEFETAKKQKAVAVLEIGESKKSEYLNGYESGFYQILVTAFEPDTGYVETLLNKDGNIQIYPKKKKGASQSGSGNRVPSHLNESPFANSIPDSTEKNNPTTKISSKKSSGRRLALPEGVAATATAVGRAPTRYEAGVVERVFAAKDRLYMETVDEMYGAVKYLRKVGGMEKAEAEAAIQAARSAQNQAQAMIGSVQYNVFSENPEKMGDGLLEIYKPTRNWSAEKQNDLELFLLHSLNIDRMTLDIRSRAWAAPLRQEVQKLESELATLKSDLARLKREKGKKQTAINNARVRRRLVKTQAAKARWKTKIDAFSSELAAIAEKINKTELEEEQKRKAVERARAEYDAALLQNKPVFGRDETPDASGNMRRDHDITAAESRELIASLKSKYGADFAGIEAVAKDLYRYLDNLQELRVAAGLISREAADRMKKLYPHYVPAYRVKNKTGAAPVKGKNTMEVSTTVRRAKGGSADIISVQESIARQTSELMRAGHINRLAGQIYDAAKTSGDTTYVEILSEEKEVGSEVHVIELSKDEALAKRIAGVTGSAKYKIIQEYILESFTGQEIVFHDGKAAVVDRSDALHIANKSGHKKTAQIAKIKELVKNAQLYAEEANADHKKFNYFCYYKVDVRYDGEEFRVYLNVGRAKNDGSYHVYDVTKKIRDTANRINGFERPKPNEGYAQKNDVSIISISHSATKSNPLSQNSMETEEITDAILRPKEGQITFYRDGKRITMKLSKELLYAFDAIRSPSVDFSNPLAKASAGANKAFKKLVTTWSPAFMIRNPIRDLQDAGLNSRHPALFAKFYASGTAAREILRNSRDWQLYRALGGFSSSVFDGVLKDASGYAGFEQVFSGFLEAKGDKGKLQKAWKMASASVKSFFAGVENVNAFMEQITRFAEFKASLAAGDSPSVAINNSAEVTTNFGRRGRLTKIANATIMPFLNPAIQGFDKIFRNVSDIFAGKKSGRQIAIGLSTLITKAFLIGMVPMIFNSLMYGEDEDYEQLREEDKENYFLVKIGDGNFIKIPRGRLAAVIGGLYNRGAKIAKGEDPDLLGYIENVKTNVTPADNVARTIFSPIQDLVTNKTWYGGDIEGREFENVAPKDRYDESTSSIAVFLGSVFNYSPKKIHYLLDQYSGVIGDFVLPATSKKEYKDPFLGNFTLDSVTNNKYSEEFYALYDETLYADTAGDEAAAYRLRYLNRVKKSVSNMNKEIDTIRQSDLTNAEKTKQVRVVRALINAAYDSALTSVGTVDEAIEATKGFDTAALEAGYTEDAAKDFRDAEVTRRVFGAETALRQYNKKVYEKYSLFHKAGIGYDELYEFYFSTRGVENDVDKQGNAIEGSRRGKILSAINALDLTKLQKLLLLLSKGYAIKDGDIKGVTAEAGKKMVLRYLSQSKDLTKEERIALAEACGFTVKNGKIVVNEK